MLYPSRRTSFDLEALEDRRLLSAATLPIAFNLVSISLPGINLSPSKTLSSIEFSQTPTAVQTGLDSLAMGDNLTAPTATQSVALGDSDGIETYSITLKGTGSRTTLTVDQNGNAVASPTQSKTTFGTLSGTLTNSNTAASGEISAIATALNLTAPTASTVVHVATTTGGVTTYAVSLLQNPYQILPLEIPLKIVVDGNGNPISPAKLPFSVMPTAIQNGLNDSAPSGDTLASDSTKNVRIETADGVTTYSVTFRSTGIKTIVSVNSSGVLTSTPYTSQTEFGDLPMAAQTELQTLGTDYGVTGTISPYEGVSVYTESDGTAIYTTTLATSAKKQKGIALGTELTISVDQNGDPTVLPSDAPDDIGGGGLPLVFSVDASNSPLQLA